VEDRQNLALDYQPRKVSNRRFQFQIGVQRGRNRYLAGSSPISLKKDSSMDSIYNFYKQLPDTTLLWVDRVNGLNYARTRTELLEKNFSGRLHYFRCQREDRDAGRGSQCSEAIPGGNQGELACIRCRDQRCFGGERLPLKRTGWRQNTDCEDSPLFCYQCDPIYSFRRIPTFS